MMTDQCNASRTAPRVPARGALVNWRSQLPAKARCERCSAMPAHRGLHRVAQGFATLALMPTVVLHGAEAQPVLLSSDSGPRRGPSLESRASSIWENGVGDGFRSGVESVGLSFGANYGVAVFGGQESHHLALVSLSYGRMLGPARGEGHWYRGNLELRGELFSGAEFSPSTEWFVGLTPHLRYSFATGGRWVPFADVGAGVTATSIGPPDLSGTFEFNLQAGGGFHWFLKDNLALTVEAHYAHWSCAWLTTPNLGLNGVTGMVGLTFFF